MTDDVAQELAEALKQAQSFLEAAQVALAFLRERGWGPLGEVLTIDSIPKIETRPSSEGRKREVIDGYVSELQDRIAQLETESAEMKRSRDGWEGMSGVHQDRAAQLEARNADLEAELRSLRA